VVEWFGMSGIKKRHIRVSFQMGFSMESELIFGEMEEIIQVL
jgi:hypothetical protein